MRREIDIDVALAMRTLAAGNLTRRPLPQNGALMRFRRSQWKPAGHFDLFGV